MPCSKIPPLCECEITQQWQSPPRRSSSPGPSPCGNIDPDEVEVLHMMPDPLTEEDYSQYDLCNELRTQWKLPMEKMSITEDWWFYGSCSCCMEMK
ncbi:hypothetical protein FKM82_008669 [Ascaphus truei]